MVVKSGDIRHDMTKCLISVDQATCAAAQIEQILSWVETTQTYLSPLHIKHDEDMCDDLYSGCWKS